MKSSNRTLYSVVCTLIGIFAPVISRFRIIGRENIPKDEAVIIAANHVSYLDIPLLGSSIYSAGRDADYVAKKELFSVPVLGTFLRMLGAFPVDREKLDRSTLREAVKRLNSGRILVIFPEGTRSPDGRLQAGKPGVGMIVRMSRAKVIPVAITGTDKALPRGSWRIHRVQITIRFGKPIDFNSMIENSGDNKGDIGEITKIIMDNINTLLNARNLSSKISL
ncbi:MAG: lysophospholipid acyltransferase family protein [Nitrospira sp.]|nr:lysophospholipid acyltransferase family protein [Nitrospira sp.]